MSLVLGLSWETADRWRRIAGSGGPEVTWFGDITGTGSDDTGTGSCVIESDVMATGSHVVWGGKPRTRREKGEGRRSDKERTGRDADMTSPWLGWETADPRQGKPRAPIRQKKTPCWKNKNDLIVFLSSAGTQTRVVKTVRPMFCLTRVQSPNG